MLIFFFKHFEAYACLLREKLLNQKTFAEHVKPVVKPTQTTEAVKLGLDAEGLLGQIP